MKEASIIKVGIGEGLSKYLYTSATVAEVSIEADKLLQNSSDPEQTVSGHLSVLDSELDSLYLAISCGESVEVIREECTAAIARLVQIYQKAGDRDGGAK
ncbi:hypothetical protein [Paenibacillus hunanensis]|uniref:Aspartyl-phosphate phosphatase Spo0E family protein n=1 Tax=Paenibacillus hunanensis TaxID=539262 RepID=A0ABU1IV93_9BACL|nr:hypothetical protein [Paenibacillus hunanensis]MDR6243176.1 hypothetical protein [Paenibacillus hunanensis]GGJ11269.1 hypothetical protein GCM10008022_20490 [Paenibacillus hunanensis]